MKQRDALARPHRMGPKLLASTILASLIVLSNPQGHPEAAAAPQALGLQVRGHVLAWNAIEGADSYLLMNSDGDQKKINGTSTELSELLDAGFYAVSVYALRQDDVLAVERLRGSVNQASQSANSPKPLSVSEGMASLATMPVHVTPGAVVFSMPLEILNRIDSWELYRNGVQVGSTRGRVLTDRQASKGMSHAYTVVINAPGWVDAAHATIPWATASCEAPCADEAELPTHEDSSSSADGLSFTIPVEVPEAKGKRPTGDFSAMLSYSDDAYVWHNTFISAAYVNPPDWWTDYWFSGDNRGFCSSTGCSTRTWVRTRVDFEEDKAYYSAGVSPTHRYIKEDGTLRYDTTKTGYNNPTVEYINENGRVRVRVRHSSSNPFEMYYPAIDYEWEYVHVSDGGVTARGLHDGAPSYETFYEPPFSSTRSRVYTFSETNFTSLAAPMDQKGRSWCKPKAYPYNCPGFGTARWV